MADDPQSWSYSAPGWADWAVSIVNGVLGDYLYDRRNPLAIEMAFYLQNRPLSLSREAILRALPQPGARLCILVHGLACHEGIWTHRDPERPESSYGALLHRDFGYTPLFVRYNTGLVIAENGAQLAALLDQLLDCYPVPITEIVLIGHSMGGLLIRSACYFAQVQQQRWVDVVRRIFYLGTPHDGAVLATLGHVAADVLQSVPNPITRLIADIINLRSRGVKDLHVGVPVSDPQAEPLPWLASAEHYLLVGHLTSDPDHVLSQLLGDGLVALPGLHPQRPAPFPLAHVQIFHETHHLQLAHDPAVYRQIKHWITTS